MRLLCCYVIAESQMAVPLEEAAASLNGAGLPVQFAVEGVVVGDGPMPAERLRSLLAAADIVIVSMINTDREARHLATLLAEKTPPVAVVFTSQPELMAFNRIGGLDGQQLFADTAYARGLARALRDAGAGPLPALPHVLLAAVPRLEPQLGPDGLGELWAYARAALYWLNASPHNLRAMLLHLATHHPAVQTRIGRTGDGDDPYSRLSEWRVPPPEIFPEVALWHPAAPEWFTDVQRYLAWYEGYWSRRVSPAGAVTAEVSQPGPPRVGVVLFRQYITSGSSRHYGALIEALEAEGLQVIAGFGGLDNRRFIEGFLEPAGIEALLNATGFNLVGAMGSPNPDAAVYWLTRLDVPYVVALPLLFQTEGQWKNDPIGLAPMQTALQIVLPELEGGIAPQVYAGRDARGQLHGFTEPVTRLARRVRRWVSLRRLPPAERRVAFVIFSFPPDKGSIGSAAYLDVFASLHRLLQAMKVEGYAVDVPESPEALRRLVLGTDLPTPSEVQSTATWGGGEARVLARLDVDAYRAIVSFADRLSRQWGPPPGEIDTAAGQLLIRGCSLGNALIAVQPSFGYEGDPMRLLLSPDASPSHSFAGFYAWLEKEWKADVLVHVGTHGALEFMPGKQVGLTPDCYPGLLVGDLPHLYWYAVNNPSEATIAKRRGYAACVTYLTPPLGEAGLYRHLAAMKEAVAAYRRAESGRRRRAALQALRQLIEDADMGGELRARGVDIERAEEAVEGIATYLQELETELIPLGLHTAGKPLGPEERAHFLAAALAHPRPEEGVPSLSELLRNPEEPGDVTTKAVIEHLVAGRDDAAWRAAGGDGDPPPPWQRLVAFARRFLDALDTELEITNMLRGLAGRYIPPSPGGEPARRPSVLPTGRNLHALDPQKIPSAVARRAGREIADDLLARLYRQLGRYPETIAVVLWGTDNIKTEGEGIAQVLYLLGVDVQEDSRGRMSRLRLIPLEELGRPRIDVVMTISGIFRDIFPSAVELLDEAVRLAASADEPEDANFVRKHALALQRQLNVSWETAASRVFSNRPGQYGTGVNIAVDSSQWEERSELGRLFIERKGFAFGAGAAGEDRRDLLAACLATAEATFQNIDSSEVSLADVDHYFEYLGGLTAAVNDASERLDPVAALVADRTRGRGRVRTLQEALQVEARTRLLNPRWYEAMLEHGYQGVHEIAVRLENTFGWSATADAVADWTYREAADTFLLNEAMRRRLAQHNPRATYRMAARLMEAIHRGYWQADPERRRRLREAFLELENAVELNPTGGSAV